ncbi:MAG: helix-turn-helix domain-containing protein, partial [Bacillota bacterium]
MAVGKTLKETRKEKGISIEEASKETKIRKKYILALENDEFSKIPGKVYQKAFLKTYADYLGIEKDNILEEYQLDQQLNGVEEESLGRKRRSKKNKKTTFFNFISKITGKAMIIVIIILLLGGVIGYNLLVMNGDNGGNENNGLAEVEQEIEEEVT